MTLKEYLKRHKITCESFGKRIGKSQSSVHRYKCSDQDLKLSEAYNICLATDGEVTIRDLYYDYIEKAAKKKATNTAAL